MPTEVPTAAAGGLAPTPVPGVVVVVVVVDEEGPATVFGLVEPGDCAALVGLGAVIKPATPVDPLALD